VTPVDYKRGKRPHVAAGAYQPERVQVCAQGMILEEHGYECDEGAIYFAGSRERVRVLFDEELRNRTRSTINGLRLVAASGRIPPPLEDSPKCTRCSLVGICLPDEVNLLGGRAAEAGPRGMATAEVTARPLYVQAHRAEVAKKGRNLADRFKEVWRWPISEEAVAALDDFMDPDLSRDLVFESGLEPCY
jgi:hypothetical protein